MKRLLQISANQPTHEKRTKRILTIEDMMQVRGGGRAGGIGEDELN